MNVDLLCACKNSVSKVKTDVYIMISVFSVSDLGSVFLFWNF